ncbi:TIGR02452 family protein [Bilifractor sp. LCP19S3_H10]|uniref:TIGR02452 family protein n=1 Tax=Bilifractor sp. LCP19S3_H10 TaxID=3438736 RepID=UPI003F93DF6B
MMYGDKRDFNKEICRENRNIVRNNGYVTGIGSGAQHISFSHSLNDHQRVIVYSPDQLDELESAFIDQLQSDEIRRRIGVMTVADEDSFAVPTDCVLNFASARRPGGGYLTGAFAQEEALCRQSTLYASIDSHKAKSTMYKFNENVTDLDTRYTLLSPCVEVFRQRDLSLKNKPFTTAVITAAAPNLNRRAAGVPLSKLRKYYRDRIRDILCIAADNGYKSITLGAWGCGAFKNDPREVAEAFRDVLVKEGYGRLFSQIRFAIPNKNSENYRTFNEVLK